MLEEAEIREPDTSREYRESSFRARLLEHIFVSELLQETWLGRGQIMEVARAEVDVSGYDLILECNGVIRHVQLKSSVSTGKAIEQKVHKLLETKPSGCVVWLIYTTDAGSRRAHLDYLFFGGGPKEPLPALEYFRIARHTKGDATGRKAERPSIRLVPRSSFVRIDGIAQLANQLFGPPKNG